MGTATILETNKMTSTSAISQVIDSPILNTRMSREGKLLRDMVYDFVFKYAGMNIHKFEEVILTGYDPLHWEKAMLYASADEIIKAIYRKTSAECYKKDKSPDWLKKIDEGSAKYKQTNWIAVLNCDPEWWIDAIAFPRKNKIAPTAITNETEKAFRAVYGLFVNWMISDFNHMSLWNIFDISTKYSTQQIIECMGRVDDYSKRSVDYLLPILAQEQAILEIQLQETKDLNDRSKQVLGAMMELRKHYGPIDWTKLKQEVGAEQEISEAFNKVKLS